MVTFNLYQVLPIIGMWFFVPAILFLAMREWLSYRKVIRANRLAELKEQTRMTALLHGLNPYRPEVEQGERLPRRCPPHWWKDDGEQEQEQQEKGREQEETCPDQPHPAGGSEDTSKQASKGRGGEP